MATTADYMVFVCEQIRGVGAVRYRKMFGEYMVYVNDKPVLLVCDNTVFVKILPELDGVMAGAERGLPYEGARPHYILDIEHAELARTVISILEPITPLPKPRRKTRREAD
ncbi:TfoX/Sxy family protein [Dysosmobacter sp.]